MIWDNTKLLTRLYYRPVSATSDIIDEASWIYAAILVIVISFVLNFAVLGHVYTSYEAVVRQVDSSELAANETLRQEEIKATTTPRLPAETSEEEYLADPATPRVVLEHRPLPVVKNYGWWFVSFAPHGQPRYAVVVMIESGASGGASCAPIAGDIYLAIREMESKGQARTLAQQN